MEYRNIQVAKMTGVKILAGLLVFGLTFSAPATAWAAESGLTEVTANGSENGEKLQAKSIDGRDTLTEVSDLVLEMIHNEEIPLTYTNYVMVSQKNVTGLDAVPVVPEFVDYLKIKVD